MKNTTKAGLAVCLLLMLRAAGALAVDLSSYERGAIRRALDAVGGGRIEPQPDNKTIESIEIVRFDVFDEADPVPDFLNVFHTITRERVIRRELLFHEGQLYDRARIDESARNLRGLRQLSLILILPLEGEREDQVRVLVITKDVWSLRMNFAIEYGDGTLNQLLLNPSEENLAGTHATIGGLFVLQPDRLTVGGVFINRRIADRRISTVLSAGAFLERPSGEVEGSYASFLYGEPLSSLESRWSWQLGLTWLSEVTRNLVNGEVRLYDSPRTLRDDRIPVVYDTERMRGAWDVTRAFGTRMLSELSLGVEVDRQVYDPRELASFEPEAAADFERAYLPASDRRISPYLQLRSFEARYMKALDLETLGLQEDFTLGHDALLRMYVASRDVGSERNLLGAYSGLAYTLPISDGFARAAAESSIEVADQERHNGLIEFSLRLTSPSLGFGRFVYGGAVVDRYLNYSNRRFGLGGETRLRGYPLNYVTGRSAVVHNVEFRSRHLNVLSAQTGLALFYDVGDAADGFSELELKHGVGFGLRTLFPQLERIVFRIDWGFPLSPGHDTFPGSMVFTFAQAFGVPGLSPPGLMQPDTWGLRHP